MEVKNCSEQAPPLQDVVFSRTEKYSIWGGQGESYSVQIWQRLHCNSSAFSFWQCKGLVAGGSGGRGNCSKQF